jgi:Transcriptional regulator
MRYKDENKSEAIFKATIQLLNEIGFAEISMSKIAKRAQVSAATIYIYFKNKEDMLNKLYMNVKEKLSRAMLRDIENAMPIQKAFQIEMENLMDYALNNRDDFLFLEQFSNSPLIEKINKEEGYEMFQTLYEIVERGKREHILKQEDSTILITYCYFPIIQLVKEHFKGTFRFSKEILDRVICMSWDAVKA